jgi:glycosyltransferase involved in cell wall biosynthesis
VKVISIHNRYLQPGGEDAVAMAEKALLEEHGHRVVTYWRSNAEIYERALSKPSLALSAFWAGDSIRELTRLLRDERPDIAHFHNTMTMISPAAYYACRKVGVPVVQTLHNYRLVCPGGALFRANRICEQCRGRILPWPSVVHGCYRSSRVQTAVVASVISLHRLIRTWQRAVDAYITPTQFARSKLLAGGLPAEKVFVKPNFVTTDPGVGQRCGGYALFAGRFADPLKLEMLLTGWQRLGGDAPLKLVGALPGDREAVAAQIAARGLRNVKIMDWQPQPLLLRLIQDALFVVFPSEWYETFGLLIVEAFACGVPVITTRIGAMAEIVEDGVTGLHYMPGDADDLAAKLKWAFSHPDRLEEMSRKARAVYEEQYCPERNYPLLLSIYERAISAVRSNGEAAAGIRRASTELGN